MVTDRQEELQAERKGKKIKAKGDQETEQGDTLRWICVRLCVQKLHKLLHTQDV